MSRQTVPKSTADPAVQKAMKQRLRMPGQSKPSLDELLELSRTWMETGGIQ